MPARPKQHKDMGCGIVPAEGYINNSIMYWHTILPEEGKIGIT